MGSKPETAATAGARFAKVCLRLPRTTSPIVACTLYRTALDVTDNEHELGADGSASGLQTAQPVVVDEVSGDTDAEAAINTLIEDQLVGRPGVDVAHDSGEDKLPVAGRLDPLY